MNAIEQAKAYAAETSNDPIAREIIEKLLGARYKNAILDDNFARDPDGEVSLDFFANESDVLSISVGINGRLSIAWRLNGVGGYRTCYATPEVFAILNRRMESIEAAEPFDETKEREMFESEYPLSQFLTWLPDSNRYELVDSSTAPESAWDGCSLCNERWRTWLDRARIAAGEG